MYGEKNSKVRLVKLLDLLRKESDEQRPLASTYLLSRLTQEGFACDRRTLYRDIAALNDCGYEIMCERSGCNRYYVAERSFDLPELQILMDAVQAASFVTEKKTRELVDKIAALGGVRQGELLKRNIVRFNTTKHSNESIFYNVSQILEAELSEKKVSFRYFDYDCKGKRVYRKANARYIVNPVATVYTNDNYYLLCLHDEREDLTTYRIDRMSDVRTEMQAVAAQAVEKRERVCTHRKEAFSMFSGESRKVTFYADKRLIDVLYDKFGEALRLEEVSEDCLRFSADVRISPTFFGWCCSFGSQLRVTAPMAVVEELREYTRCLTMNYRA